MSTPSLKIEAYGTPSSLVPGSIQNARNNNLEILTVIQTIPANTTESAVDTPLEIAESDLNGKKIVGSCAEFSVTTSAAVSIGTNETINDLLSSQLYTTSDIHPLLANLANQVTLPDINSVINVRSTPGNTLEFTLTLRLILIKD